MIISPISKPIIMIISPISCGSSWQRTATLVEKPLIAPRGSSIIDIMRQKNNYITLIDYIIYDIWDYTYNISGGRSIETSSPSAKAAPIAKPSARLWIPSPKITWNLQKVIFPAKNIATSIHMLTLEKKKTLTIQATLEIFSGAE